MTTEECTRILTQDVYAREHQAKRLRARSLEESLERIDVVGPALVCGSVGCSDFIEVDGYYTRFRRGDQVELRTRTGRDATTDGEMVRVKGVTYPEPGKVRYEISKKRKNRPLAGVEYYIFPHESTGFGMRLRKRLREVEALPRNARFCGASLESARSHGLNSGQWESLRYLVESGGDCCVQGPPGTGKTQLIRAVVACALDAGLTIGVAAFTHNGVDNALSRLLEISGSHSFLRVGDSTKVNSHMYPPGWLKAQGASSFSVVDSAPLFAATTHSWILSASRPSIDLLLLDEASQIPPYMTTALMSVAPQLVCLGDHRQLPPILQARIPDGIPGSLFGQLLSEETPMLNIQYRMNEQIQSWSAQRYYGGKLVPAEGNANRDALRPVGQSGVPFGDRCVQLSAHSNPSRSIVNIGEAAQVAKLAKAIAESGSIPLEEIGIICPHRAQGGAVSQAIQSEIGTNRAERVAIDTVERFQGQEKEVILYSLGAETAETDKNSGDAFLSDPRRINVAVTRAKSRFYCFASEKLLEESSERAGKNSEYELGPFLHWCSSGQAAG